MREFCTCLFWLDDLASFILPLSWRTYALIEDGHDVAEIQELSAIAKCFSTIPQLTRICLRHTSSWVSPTTRPVDENKANGVSVLCKKFELPQSSSSSMLSFDLGDFRV